MLTVNLVLVLFRLRSAMSPIAHPLAWASTATLSWVVGMWTLFPQDPVATGCTKKDTGQGPPVPTTLSFTGLGL